MPNGQQKWDEQFAAMTIVHQQEIVVLFPTCAGAWPPKIKFHEEASSMLIAVSMFARTTNILLNHNSQLIVNFNLAMNSEGAQDPSDIFGDATFSLNLKIFWAQQTMMFQMIVAMIYF